VIFICVRRVLKILLMIEYNIINKIEIIFYQLYNVLKIITNEIMTSNNIQSTTYWSATALEVMIPPNDAPYDGMMKKNLGDPEKEEGCLIDAGAGASSEDDQEDMKLNQFGNCPICKNGLNDRADFTINYENGSKHGIMMCKRCHSNSSMSEMKKTCTNCHKKVSVSECIIGSKDPVSGEFIITFCRSC
jgi:hypothetical protein